MSSTEFVCNGKFVSHGSLLFAQYIVVNIKHVALLLLVVIEVFQDGNDEKALSYGFFLP